MKKIEIKLPSNPETLFGSVSDYEPARNNRFHFEFPSDFNISSTVINKVTPPKLNKGLFFDSWDDIQLSLYDLIDLTSNNSILEIATKKNFLVYLSVLDAVGEAVTKFEITVKNVKSIQFGTSFSYGDDGIRNILITLKVKNCRILS